MKSKILLLLVATAAAALAAALGQGDGANADQRDDEIMPRDENPHTVWITKVMTIPRASLAALASMASLLPTTSSSVVVQTAFVYETIWSDPALSAWVTLKGGTKLPPTYSTSTSYSTITVIAHSVTYTTTTLHVRALETAGASSPDTGDLPPYSSVITAVGSPLWTSSRTAEPLPPPMLSAPVSSTITTLFPLHSDPTEQPPPLPFASNASDTATLTLSEIPLPTAEPPATTLMTSVIPVPTPTSAPAPGNFSCVENWCSDNGASYCLYWGGITAENSAGEPLPGMVLTHLGGCTLVTTTLGGGLATTMVVSAPDTTSTSTPASAPAAPTTPAGPGATPAPFSEPSSLAPDRTADVTLLLRPRGRGRV